MTAEQTINRGLTISGAASIASAEFWAFFTIINEYQIANLALAPLPPAVGFYLMFKSLHESAKEIEVKEN